MINYEIKNRFTGEAQFTAKIDCDENASRSVKVGLSIKWAIKAKANLQEVNLRGADLWEADLSEAYLGGAYLEGADLREADLRGANLGGAKGIVSFGPVGDGRRIGFAMWHESKVHLRLGCFFGGEKEGLAAIREKYGKGDPYYTFARAACSELKLRHALPAKQREVA